MVFIQYARDRIRIQVRHPSRYSSVNQMRWPQLTPIASIYNMLFVCWCCSNAELNARECGRIKSKPVRAYRDRALAELQPGPVCLLCTRGTNCALHSARPKPSRRSKTVSQTHTGTSSAYCVCVLALSVSLCCCWYCISCFCYNACQWPKKVVMRGDSCWRCVCVCVYSGIGIKWPTVNWTQSRSHIFLTI